MKKTAGNAFAVALLGASIVTSSSAQAIELNDVKIGACLANPDIASLAANDGIKKFFSATQYVPVNKGDKSYGLTTPVFVVGRPDLKKGLVLRLDGCDPASSGKDNIDLVGVDDSAKVVDVIDDMSVFYNEGVNGKIPTKAYYTPEAKLSDADMKAECGQIVKSTEFRADYCADHNDYLDVQSTTNNFSPVFQGHSEVFNSLMTILGQGKDDQPGHGIMAITNKDGLIYSIAHYPDLKYARTGLELAKTAKLALN